MSPRRFLIELSVMLGVSIGAFIGYCAGQQFDNQSIQLALAFAGMAIGGAFTDICIRGDTL